MQTTTKKINKQIEWACRQGLAGRQDKTVRLVAKNKYKNVLLERTSQELVFDFAQVIRQQTGRESEGEPELNNAGLDELTRTSEEGLES